MEIYFKLTSSEKKMPEKMPIVKAKVTTQETAIGECELTTLPVYYNLAEGDNIEVVSYGETLFTGKIRRIDCTDKEVKFKAKDVKWTMLLNTETYVCENKTLSEVFRYMADCACVPVGEVAETTRVIPYKIWSNVQCGKILNELVREEKFRRNCVAISSKFRRRRNRFHGQTLFRLLQGR
jgi:hypothetical protein